MTVANIAPSASVVNMRAYDPEIVGSIFTRVDMNWSRDARAQFVVSPLGDLSLIRSMHSANKSKSRRLERHINDDDDRYFFACMPLKGAMQVRHLGGPNRLGWTCDLKAHHLTILSTREEYEIAMSEVLDAIWLRIPAPMLNSYVISLDDVLGRSLNVRAGLGHVAKKMMYETLCEDTQLDARGRRLLSQSLLSFLGEIINSNTDLGGNVAKRGRRQILNRAKDYVEEHIHDDALSPAQIAKGVGISSRYLSEIFAADGSSPMRWVRKRRLELCRIELERRQGGEQLICEIAYSMGFTNVSSFNRSFKSHFGQSPREMIAKKAN